jgi:hypothetical protein
MKSRLRQQKRREKAQRKRQQKHPATMDELSALHEAAHVVAAIFSGSVIQHVTLTSAIPETVVYPNDDRAAAVFSMGPAPATLRAYGTLDGCFRDIHDAVAHADDAGLEAWEIWAEAKSIIDTEWDTVLAIAQLLKEHRHITGAQLESMLDPAG